jgi:hypothetical protein
MIHVGCNFPRALLRQRQHRLGSRCWMIRVHCTYMFLVWLTPPRTNPLLPVVPMLGTAADKSGAAMPEHLFRVHFVPGSVKTTLCTESSHSTGVWDETMVWRVQPQICIELVSRVRRVETTCWYYVCILHVRTTVLILRVRTPCAYYLSVLLVCTPC